MAKRPKVNSTTGTANASPLNKRRGLIMKKRDVRAKVAARRMEKPPTPKKARRDERRSGHSGKHFTLSTEHVAKLAAETMAAQANVTPKTKKTDPRAFDHRLVELREGRYRIMGRRKSTSPRPMPIGKIEEGRLPYLLSLEDNKRFIGVEDRSIEMQVGGEWHIMTHPEFFAQVREALAVTA